MESCLTIVIPVYNVKDYLSECLESIQESDFKIILVNDGSTDGSDLICQKFQQTYSNVLLINKSNGGLSDARNAAYPYIDTEYVFFLDSDDYIDAKNLKLAVDFAIRNSLDWLQCGYVYKYETYSLLLDKHNTESIILKQEVLRQLIDDSYIKNFAWGKIYRTSIIKKILFPKNKYFEDVLWQYLLIANSDKFGVFHNVVTYYRQRSDSISGVFSARNLDLLDGLKDRLSCISADYPDFEPLAAFNLWRLCSQYEELSKSQSEKDLNNKIEIFNHSLIADYEKSIRKFIDSRGLFKRLYYKAILDGKWYRSILNLANRIYNRFSVNRAYKVLRDD